VKNKDYLPTVISFAAFAFLIVTTAANGMEFAVYPEAEYKQSTSSIAVDYRGDFSIFWRQNMDGDHPSAQKRIYGRMYDRWGNPYADAFQVSEAKSENPTAAYGPDGNLLVGWTDRSDDDDDIMFRRYGANGTPIGGPFIAAENYEHVIRPLLGIDQSGTSTLVWGHQDSNAPGKHVWIRRFDQEGSPLGAAYEANTESLEGCNSAAMTSNSDGDFVVVWDQMLEDEGMYVWYRQYDSSGNPTGDPIRVDPGMSEFHAWPSAAMAPDGHFVVAWDIGDSSDVNVQARVFDASGSPTSPVFTVNTFSFSNQQNSRIGMDAAGNFTIVWQGSGAQDGDETGVFAQRYDTSGNPLGGEYQVNDEYYMFQRAPDIAMSDNGSHIISWSSYGRAHAKVYDSNGVEVGGEPEGQGFIVNESLGPSHRAPAIALSASGQFVVSWDKWSDGGPLHDPGSSGILSRYYDANNQPLSGETFVNTTPNSLQKNAAADTHTAGYVLAWQNDEDDGSLKNIYARRYDTAGMPLGDEFQINTHTAGQQELPDVVCTPDGRYTIVWESDGQDGSGYGVFGQRFDALGNPSGAEFQVNTYTSFDQNNAAVAADTAGNFAVVWQSTGQISPFSMEDIFCQRFDSTGTKIGSELYVNETVLSTQYNPDIEMNPAGDFIIVWEGGSQGVMSRWYNSAGTPLTGETFLADGYNPVLAMDGIGKYVVVWDNVDGIFGQRFFADGTAYGAQFMAETARNTSSVPAVSINDLGEFVIAWDDLSYDDLIKVRRLSFDLEAEFSWNLYPDDPGGEWCWVLELFDECEGIAAELEWEVSGPDGFFRTGSFRDPKFDLFEAGEYTVVLTADGLGISDSISHTITVSAPIPEPSTLLLLAPALLGLAGVAFMRRK